MLRGPLPLENALRIATRPDNARKTRASLPAKDDDVKEPGKVIPIVEAFGKVFPIEALPVVPPASRTLPLNGTKALSQTLPMLGVIMAQFAQGCVDLPTF